MSYDIQLFYVPPGRDPLEAFDELLEQEEVGQKPVTPPDPLKEERKQKTAAALLLAYPGYQIFPFNYEKIAQLRKISVAEAQAKNRHVVLEPPHEAPAVQISLYDDEAFVTMPYWYNDPKLAQLAFEQMWGCLRIIQETTGYAVYDPQSGTILDLAEGYEKELAGYVKTAGLLPTLLGQKKEEKKSRGGNFGKNLQDKR